MNHFDWETKFSKMTQKRRASIGLIYDWMNAWFSVNKFSFSLLLFAHSTRWTMRTLVPINLHSFFFHVLWLNILLIIFWIQCVFLCCDRFCFTFLFIPSSSIPHNHISFSWFPNGGLSFSLHSKSKTKM